MSLLDDAFLYLIATAPAGDPAAWIARIEAAVDGGVDVVQLRAKAADTARRRALLTLLTASRAGRVPLIVNDDLDAVLDDDGRLVAAGVHLGRDDAAELAPPGTPLARRIAAGLDVARARLGPEAALGTSTRTRAEVETAFAAGADHVGFGAMAATTTKSDTVRADPDVLEACTRADLGPIFPIGGLDADVITGLARRGVRRAAVGSAILDADDPADAARRCRLALGV